MRTMKRLSQLWRLSSFAAAAFFFTVFCRGSDLVSPPLAFGSPPSESQLRWQATEYYGFIHFGLNTYTDQEWGPGDVSPQLFNPTDFDADSIVHTMKDAGMRGIILVCKHHDGFCLWPSKFTDYSVKKAPWKNGQGDVVREISDACQKYGVKFGVYLSPWDRNSTIYGKPEYINFYRSQLSELLTNYGDIFMSWHDGAEGTGEGYYGGAHEVRRVNSATYYDWPGTWAIVHRLQPNAVIFSDCGPDVRWIGNENGTAGETCWDTTDLRDGYPGMNVGLANATGIRAGQQWIPPECDLSIRPDWFYHERDNSKVKPAWQLIKAYCDSVGHGACLNLNVPLDKRGMFFSKDLESLRGLKRWLDTTFATNLAIRSVLSASNIRGNDRRFAPENVLDGDRTTYWATDDEVRTPQLVVDLGKLSAFNVIRICEYLPLGQRVDAYGIDVWQNDKWREVFKGTSIGSQRIFRVPAKLTTEKVRLRITSSAASPAIAEFGIFAESGS